MFVSGASIRLVMVWVDIIPSKQMRLQAIFPIKKGLSSRSELLPRTVSMLDTFSEYGELIHRLMSGFAVLLIDGCPKAFAFGVQGFETRGISEPSTEGSK